MTGQKRQRPAKAGTSRSPRVRPPMPALGASAWCPAQVVSADRACSASQSPVSNEQFFELPAWGQQKEQDEEPVGKPNGVRHDQPASRRTVPVCVWVITRILAPTRSEKPPVSRFAHIFEDLPSIVSGVVHLAHVAKGVRASRWLTTEQPGEPCLAIGFSSDCGRFLESVGLDDFREVHEVAIRCSATTRPGSLDRDHAAIGYQAPVGADEVIAQLAAPVCIEDVRDVHTAGPEGA